MYIGLHDSWKVELSPYMPSRHEEEVELQLCTLSTPVLGRGAWSGTRFTHGKETRHPLYRRLGGPQGRSGWVQQSCPRGFQTPDSPASSKSLHRLRSPGCPRQDSQEPKLISLLTFTTALLVGGSRDRSPVVSLATFSEATDGTMCPGIDSASKNEYQENSWG